MRDGRLQEARQILDARTERTRGSELHRLESRLAQAEGDIPAATLAAARDLAAATATEEATRFSAAAVRLAGLHELAGDTADADEVLIGACDSPIVANMPVLRLELLLDRMNARERMRMNAEESDDTTRWLLGLEARALLQRSDRREISSNSALVRLLAAAFGREEPDRIREAVRHVGLGHDEDHARVDAVIVALAQWDSSLTPPGSLAKKYLRLENTDVDSVHRAWSAVAGLGTDAGLLLDSVWRQNAPPEDVRERLREIYLWWAVDVASNPRSVQSHVGPAEHFLTESPINWARPEILALEELILTAYPTTLDCMTIASKAGLDLELVSWTSSGRRFTREIIATAGRAGRSAELVKAILDDPASVSVHAQLRELVGDEWLAANGVSLEN